MEFYNKCLRYFVLSSFAFSSTYLPISNAMDSNQVIEPSVKAITDLYKMFPEKEEIINKNCQKLLYMYLGVKNAKAQYKSAIKYSPIIVCFIIYSPYFIKLIKYLYNKIRFYKDKFKYSKNIAIQEKRLKELSDLEINLNEVLPKDLSKLVIEYANPKDVIFQNKILSCFNKINDSIESRLYENFSIEYSRFPNPIIRIVTLCYYGLYILCACDRFIIEAECNHADFNKLYEQTVNACKSANLLT